MLGVCGVSNNMACGRQDNDVMKAPWALGEDTHISQQAFLIPSVPTNPYAKYNVEALIIL